MSTSVLNASSTSGKWPSSIDPSLYINADGFSQVGFHFANETSSSNVTTTGFKFYGSNLVWVDSAGDLNMKFWAVQVDVDDIWALYWNSNSSLYPSSGTPVSVRTV